MGVYLIVVHLLFGCHSVDTSNTTSQQVTLAGRPFVLELALDQKTRFQGLSDRIEISPDGGMLFVFPKPRRLEFVMRRCLVPIDLVYLGPGGRIITTHSMTVEPPDRPENQLHRYSSHYDAQFALELKGGTIQQLKLTAGTKINLPFDRLKQRAR